MNPTDGLIATILEQLPSLTHEFRNYKSNTDENINNMKEFTETSDRNRAKEIRDLAELLGIKSDTETDQPHMSTHLETGADNNEIDGPNTSQSNELITSRLDKETTAAKNKASKQERSYAPLSHYGVEMT